MTAVPSVAAPGPSFALAAWSLAEREVVRFLRQRSRLTGALLQPVIFWVLFGAGLSDSFRMPGGADYQTYFLPGIAAMIVMFTAIFSSISVIQDRHEGFLQGVLASPANRAAIVSGKLLGGTVLAVGQAVLFLLLAPLLQWIGLSPSLAAPSLLMWPAVLGMLVLTAVSLCALGYAFAWRLDSVQGFHAVMSVVLFPMWLLSGAFFPVAPSGWLAWVMRANPLTYGVAGLRHVMSPGGATPDGAPSLAVCVGVTALCAAAWIALDVWLTQRPGSAAS